MITRTPEAYHNTPDMTLILSWIMHVQPVGSRTKKPRKPSLENSLRAFERFLGNKVASRAVKCMYQKGRVDKFLKQRKLCLRNLFCTSN